jgi:hypothetical protein
LKKKKHPANFFIFSVQQHETTVSRAAAAAAALFLSDCVSDVDIVVSPLARTFALMNGRRNKTSSSSSSFSFLRRLAPD